MERMTAEDWAYVRSREYQEMFSLVFERDKAILAGKG